MNTANINQHKKLSLYKCVGFTCSRKHAYTALGWSCRTSQNTISKP